VKKLLAWHFVAQDRILANGSGLLVEPGYVYSEPDGELKMCEHGMHFSVDPFDALQYAPGPWLCRVRCWGDVKLGSDKGVCRHREVISMVDISRAMRLFACWCVRETPLPDGRKVWDLLIDGRSRTAVEVAERHACGGATDEELAAAWDSARAAAWAAGDSARAAGDSARAAARAVHRAEFGRLVARELARPKAAKS
jgi:hypothetical protein